MTTQLLSDNDLDLIFREARSHNGWLDKPVSEVTLRAVYDLLRWGPTGYNSCPARFVFVTSQRGRETLADGVMDLNRDKVLTAPVVAIVGQDMAFYDKLPTLAPWADGVPEMIAKNEAMSQAIAFRNSSLQGAYLMIAARSLGLDCGPMSGIFPDKVDEAFFADTTVKTNFICALGYGDHEKTHPRGPRLSFGEACRFA
ncbi:MAG: malonic semialdehyde reductase [Kordiimonas sp.]|nr:malonic semialdehyde reductase [Kordiimonas sp.]